MAGRGLCGQAQAGLCRGLPLQAGTHSKNPQCLVDSQAQAQAQGSRRGDTVVAATERRVPCAALQAAVQSHTAPGLLVQPPGPASKHSPGALGRSVCRCFSGVSSVQGPADVPRGLLPPNPTPQWRPAAAPWPSALSGCSHASCTLPLSPRQPPSSLPTASAPDGPKLQAFSLLLATLSPSQPHSPLTSQTPAFPHREGRMGRMEQMPVPMADSP